MWTHNRSKLIKNLNESALGLIDEARHVSPEQAKELVELAGDLDCLRVRLMQAQNGPIIDLPGIRFAPANCA